MNKEITNKLTPYSDKEISFLTKGKVTIATSNADINKFINNTTKVKSSNNKIYLGIINNKLSKNIYNTLKINIQNYNVSLKSDAIKHIITHHSTEKEYLRGQIPITQKDFLLIPKIISNYDKVWRSGLTKEGKPSITFQKQIKNTYYLIKYVSDKNKILEVQTMYKK